MAKRFNQQITMNTKEMEEGILNIIKAGVRTEGCHYLQPVIVLGEMPETRYQGHADPALNDGAYIELCECHQAKTSTNLVEVINGEYFASYEIKFAEVLKEASKDCLDSIESIKSIIDIDLLVSKGVLSPKHLVGGLAMLKRMTELFSPDGTVAGLLHSIKESNGVLTPEWKFQNK